MSAAEVVYEEALSRLGGAFAVWASNPHPEARRDLDVALSNLRAVLLRRSQETEGRLPGRRGRPSLTR